MNYYELDNQVKEIMALYEQGLTEAVDMETGEVFNLAEKLESLEMEKEQKIKNLALYVKNNAMYIDGLKAEKKRIMDEIARMEKRVDGAKDYLKEITEGKGIKDPQFVISYRKTKSTNILDLSLIPDQYLVMPEPKPDKTAIKKAIEAGENIEGAEIVESVSMSVK